MASLRLYFLFFAILTVSQAFVLPLQRDHAYGTRGEISNHRATLFVQQNTTLPIEGSIWPVSIYWVDIEVGTPSRTFPVAVDTGSGDLDIPMINCNGCPITAPNNFYDPTNSSTGNKKCVEGQCHFSNTYQTCDPKHPDDPCTIAGMFYEDDVTLGGLGPVSVTFGAIASQTSNFYQFQRICGVMGVTGATGPGQSVLGALIKGGYMKEEVFGLCFVQGTTSNGTMTIGSLDERLYKGQLSYGPNTGADQGYYMMEMSTMSVFGKTIAGTSRANSILDSGTNVLLLPDQIFTSLKETFESQCDSNPLPGVCGGSGNLFEGDCLALDESQIDQFPNITMTLGGVDIVVPPNSYLVYLGDSGERCLGIINTGRGGFLIVGDSVMENYYIAYDIAQNRIGWAEVNRATCGSL